MRDGQARCDISLWGLWQRERGRDSRSPQLYRTRIRQRGERPHLQLKAGTQKQKSWQRGVVSFLRHLSLINNSPDGFFFFSSPFLFSPLPTTLLINLFFDAESEGRKACTGKSLFCSAAFVKSSRKDQVN